jgi:thiosulfate/3-mercaptopyruvate sulfurtransferase
VSRYVIVGAGAIGVTLAAQLHEAGRSVALVARGAQLRAAQAGGMTYVRPEGSRPLAAPIHDGPRELRLTDADVLVIATKTQDVAGVVERWSRELVTLADGSVAEAGEVLPVLTTQNGLEAERVALRHFRTVIAGVLALPAAFVEAGVVVAAGAPAVGHIWLGAHPDRHDARTDAIAADLRAANLEAHAVPDISRYQHGKLIISSTFVLDALYPPSPLRDAAAQLLREEAATVLAGAGLDSVDLGRELAGSARRSDPQPTEGHAYGGSSTWQSLSRAGSLETDFLNGEVVLLARLSGQPAPAQEAITARIHRAQRERIPPRSLAEDDLLRTLPALAETGGQTQDGVRARVLVDALSVHRSLLGAAPPAILDVRWKLGDPDGQRHFRAGHIPTAVFVDLDAELAAPPTAQAGRHPLPAIRDLQDAARAWGVREGQAVVVYDDAGGLAAARAWWLLRWAGVRDVRILDGALSAWRDAGLPLETGDGAAGAGDVTLSEGHLPVLDDDSVARAPEQGVLLDARAGERYRGEQEPVDPRAGHIPGAISAPTTENLDASGAFLSTEQLRRRFADLGVDGTEPIGVYCGSGVTAAHLLAALEITGLQATLFPGSWSAWSADPRRPVAVGARPH